MSGAVEYLFNQMAEGKSLPKNQPERGEAIARMYGWIDENGNIVNKGQQMKADLADLYGDIGRYSAILGTLPTPAAPTFQGLSLGASVMSDMILRPNPAGFVMDSAADKAGMFIANRVGAPKALIQTTIEVIKASPEYSQKKDSLR